MASSAALLSAAVKAACHAGAPRRTVAAVAAAVTSVLMKPVAAAAPPTTVTGLPTGPSGVNGCTMDELEQRLRDARADRRKLKRQRRREKARARNSPADHEMAAEVSMQESLPTADPWEELDSYPQANTWAGMASMVGSVSGKRRPRPTSNAVSSTASDAQLDQPQATDGSASEQHSLDRRVQASVSHRGRGQREQTHKKDSHKQPVPDSGWGRRQGP